MRVVTIGRNNDNDVVINDAHASRYHLQIIQHDDGHYSLADFGSTNGTYVNGQKVSGEMDLMLSDIVRIGNTTIPWRMYFESDNEIKTELIGNGINDGYEETDYSPTPSVSNDDQEDISAGLIISIIISVIMIIGGLSGTLALRGTGSSGALVVVGVILLIIDIVKIVSRNKNR